MSNLYKEAKRRETKEYEKKFNTPEARGRLQIERDSNLSRADRYHRFQSERRSVASTLHHAGRRLGHSNEDVQGRHDRRRKLVNPGDELANKGDYSTRLSTVKSQKQSRKDREEKSKLHEETDRILSESNTTNGKPKFLSTRKGKAIAAGGALATVGALGGVYAYKKHLDKKRQESENAKASTTDR